MDRVRRPLLIAAAIAVVAVVLVAVLVFVVSRPPAESTAEGIVVQVTPSGTLAVASFQLRTDDGRTLTFSVGELDLSPPGFNGPHLYVHRATLQPIIVSYRTEGSGLVAVRLVDAPVSSPSAGSGTSQPAVATVAVATVAVAFAMTVERS